MTRQIRFAPLVVLALATLLLAAPVAAQNFTVRYSGATSATEIDIDDDGIPGVLATGYGRATGALRGAQVHTHAVFDAQPASDGNCAAGEVENRLVASTNVLQDRKRDQLYLLLDSGFLCADATFTTFTLEIEETIVGGTGKFEGATGEATTTCTGVFLALDLIGPGGRPAHGAFACRTEGSID